MSEKRTHEEVIRHAYDIVALAVKRTQEERLKGLDSVDEPFAAWSSVEHASTAVTAIAKGDVPEIQEDVDWPDTWFLARYVVESLRGEALAYPEREARKLFLDTAAAVLDAMSDHLAPKGGTKPGEEIGKATWHEVKPPEAPPEEG